MKKLKLNINELKIESFNTQKINQPKGTINGNSAYPGCDSHPGCHVPESWDVNNCTNTVHKLTDNCYSVSPRCDVYTGPPNP